MAEAIVSISQQIDVNAFVCREIGDGTAIGAVYHYPPHAETAIDRLLLALARHVQQRQPPDAALPLLTPKDRWSEAAGELLAAGLPPLPEGFGAETSVDRLIRWIDPRCRRVLIGVIVPLDPESIVRMRAVAGWMARASACDTALIYGTGEHPGSVSGAPRSSVERTLAEHLERVPDLRGLFQTNARVMTVFVERPRVDFVWTAGRLIVEIDGYHFHSSREQFAGDRQRDYMTGVSGYQTLRLTDDEVLTDTDLAIAKIRRYVHLRKKLIHV